MSPAAPSMIAKIHVAKKQLGLAELDYRALLQRVTGQASAKGCTVEQLDAVIRELKALGFRPTGAPAGFAQPHVRLIYALWKEAGRLGAIESPTKAAERAFVGRQTQTPDLPEGRDAPEFLAPAEASKVSEALKAMIRRAKSNSKGA